MLCHKGEQSRGRQKCSAQQKRTTLLHMLQPLESYFSKHTSVNAYAFSLHRFFFFHLKSLLHPQRNATMQHKQKGSMAARGAQQTLKAYHINTMRATMKKKVPRV